MISSLNTFAATCCAHWGADGTCHHEYACADSEIDDPSSSDDDVQSPTTDDREYTRDENGNLKRTCCAHWSADGTCFHPYMCVM